MCPNSGPQINWTNELQRLHEALRFARDLEYVGMQKSANAVWNRMYSQIEEESASMSGLAASMTARAAAHVRRLALILCLMDNHDCIETHHLRAAKRIWDYCEDSARYIFGGLTKDQEMILGWVRKNGSVTIPQITQQLFHKHRKADWVRTQVNGLIQAGKAVGNGDQVAAR
jgi:DNA replicative helicase MCM subunit Mcm2 (Cdc46/Mcm family)